jgi:hypothetical protein
MQRVGFAVDKDPAIVQGGNRGWIPVQALFKTIMRGGNIGSSNTPLPTGVRNPDQGIMTYQQAEFRGLP